MTREGNPSVGLRRVLGMPEVTAGGIGIIIGAGIYVLVGTATAEAGAGVWLAFLIAAAISFLTALSYMELASMYPSAAGEYQYTRQAFPEWLAFSVGWIMISGLVVAAAAISLGFARYLGYFVDVDVRLGALFLLVAVVLIAGAGIRESLRLTMLLSAIQVGGLVFVVAIGAPHLGQHNVFQFNGVDGVLSAAALVFFAFIGFDEVITLSEETADPTRTIPRALGLALGLSTLLYIAVAVMSVSVLGAEALGTSDRPLADVIGHAIGGDGARVMAGLAVVSTTNTTLLAVTAASRLMYGMAADQSLPSLLARVHPTRQTPLVALVCAAGLAGVFVLVRDLKLVASTTDFAIYLVFLAVNATLVVLRYRRPDQPRAFVVPGKVGRMPIVPIVASLTVLLMMAFLDTTAIGLGLLLAGSGLVIFLVFGSDRGRETENAGL